MKDGISVRHRDSLRSLDELIIVCNLYVMWDIDLWMGQS